MQGAIDYVLRTVEERKVAFVQLWFTDVLGTSKTFSITPAELPDALEFGMSFDGSVIDGFSRVSESDMIAKPVPETFQVLPWLDSGEPVARVFCDIITYDKLPFDGDPRFVLRRSLDRAADMGFSFFVAPEIEFFYFKRDDVYGTSSIRATPLDGATYFDLEPCSTVSNLRKRTVLALEDIGIPVEYNQHEDAPSQHEIDLRYTDALTMADNVMTTRAVVKEIAAAAGVHATFMPKPVAGVQGSGMHTYVSLFRDNQNAFYDANDADNLSDTAKRFVAGVLHHAPEMAAITNQWVNSYKRLVPGHEAPIYRAWSRNNGSAIVNVPHTRRAESTRIEYRAPDPATNPYLCFAAILSAGLKGVEEGYELPPITDVNLYALSRAELASQHRLVLPSSLDAAIDELEGSELMAQTLGNHVFDWLIRNKREEWAAYESEVTQHELDRYLPRI